MDTNQETLHQFEQKNKTLKNILPIQSMKL